MKLEYFLNNLKMLFRPFTAISFCLGIVAFSSVCFLITSFLTEKDSFIYTFIFALFTGVIASSFITIAVEMNSNYQRNKKRWIKLTEYFNFISDYQMNINIKKKLLQELEIEDKDDDTGYEDSRLAAWRTMIKEVQIVFEADDAILHKNEFEYAAIAEQMNNSIFIFEKVLTEFYDLLSFAELEIIQRIVSNIESIKKDIKLLIVSEVDANSFYAKARGKGGLVFIEATRKYENHINNRLNSVFPEIITRPELLISNDLLFDSNLFLIYLQEFDADVRKLERFVKNEPIYSSVLKWKSKKTR